MKSRLNAIKIFRMKKLIFLLFTIFCCSQANCITKVACIGNSITYGMGISNRNHDSYPAQLQQMLGDKYEIGNFGKSGATLLRKGHMPYMQQIEFAKALEFKPDIVVIHLGINDTDPRDWPNYRDEFIGDYRALIDTFRTINKKCRIFIAKMTPIGHQHRRFDSGTRVWHEEIQQAIITIANTAKDVQLIDFYEPLLPYPNLIPDALHPNETGAKILAETVYRHIIGNFGGLQMPDIYSDNMILQHNQPITIRGIANAGEQVTVEIGNQKQKTVTTPNGKWEITLKPLKSSEVYTLSIATKHQKLTYKNVLAGEVWLCSGQSNMEFQLSRSFNAEKEIGNALHTDIRLYNMKPRWHTDNNEWSTEALDSINMLKYFSKNHWEICQPNTVENFSAIAYYFGKVLHDSLDVPIGLICNAVGGSPIESWIDRPSIEEHLPAVLRNWEENDFIQEWVRKRAALNIQKSNDPQQRHPYHPCYLYESAIAPLAQFPIKGVIWYQGGSNAHSYETHSKLFKMLVASWRKSWENDEMPFYYVQLSSLNRPSWTWFRNSQRLLLDEIPYTGMAVSTDCGDSLNVHPIRKKEVGDRLAAWALNKTYSLKKITPSGPLFKNASFSGHEVVVSFEYDKDLHTSDNAPLRTFELAGEDGIFYPAEATISRNKVKVKSKKVKKPKMIRYAWQPYTNANLVNNTGFPASTFRAEKTE